MSTGQGRTPEQIQAEIEATRSEMGDTVSAAAEKADVKKQAKEKVGEIKAQAPSAARENPVPIALAGAFLAGIVVGRASRRR